MIKAHFKLTEATMTSKAAKRILVLSLLIIFILPIFSANLSDDLLLADQPFYYGKELFKERILEQTEGNREAVGLVLSGGSARAFAHIGVLQLLEENDIVPDFIISNSMGSIVGILYAAGLSPQQIKDVIYQLDVSQLFDLSFPISGGILNINRFISLVGNYLGKDLNIEELAIPIMIIGEDLKTKRQVQIMEGNLMEVMAAAFALPVYFPPVDYQDHLLVDGGITNLVPLSIAFEYTDDVIVSTTFYDAKDINLKNVLSNLNVSIDIGKRRMGVVELLEHPEAIWIRCEVENFSFMDFDAVKELTALGYESANKKFDQLNKLYKKGVSEKQIEFRGDFTLRQQKVHDSYRIFQRGPVLSFSQQLFLGLKSFNSFNDQWYLRNDVVFGLMYQIRLHRLHYALHGGLGWKTVYPMKAYLSINNNISYQIIDPLIVEGDLLLSTEGEGFKPKMYHRLALKFRQRYFSNQLRATLTGWWEQQLDNTFKFEETLVNAGIELQYQSNEIERLFVATEVAYQLAGIYNRHFLHTKVDTVIPLPADLNLKLGYTGRYALDFKGSIPIYFNDGFKTASKSLLMQGRSNSEDNLSNAMVIGRVGIDFEPSKFKPTAGELLIFEKSAVGLFSDLLFNQAKSFKPDFVAGVNLSTTISFLGLNSMPLNIFVGYDSPTNGVSWGFLLGKSL
jgi:NTE family protein